MYPSINKRWATSRGPLLSNQRNSYANQLLYDMHFIARKSQEHRDYILEDLEDGLLNEIDKNSRIRALEDKIKSIISAL